VKRPLQRIERLAAITKKQKRTIVGLMSGTSVDAIDAVLVHIEGTARKRANIEPLLFRSFPFPRDVQKRINTLFDKKKARIEEICHLDFVVGELFAAAATELIRDAGLTNDQVDLIATAGQTVWYKPRPVVEAWDGAPWPKDPVATRSLLTLGDPDVIAERTGIVTIGDLRHRDIACCCKSPLRTLKADKWGRALHRFGCLDERERGSAPCAFRLCRQIVPFQQGDERFLSDAYRDSMVAALVISIV